MTVSTLDKTMLYCPKCQKTYEDGAQRFCTDDRARLLRAASADEPARRAGGVFSSILNRAAETDKDAFASAPRFSKADRAQFTRPTFEPPATSKIFKSETEIEPTFESSAFESEPTIETESRADSEPIVFEPLPYLTNDEDDAHEIQTAYDDEATMEIVEPTDEAEEVELIAQDLETPIPAPTIPIISAEEKTIETDAKESIETKPATRVLPPLADEDELEFTGAKTVDQKAKEKPAWEKRSPEMPNEPTVARTWLSVLGVAVLLAFLWGIWSYFLNRPTPQPVVEQPTAETNAAPEQTAQTVAPIEANIAPSPAPEEIETPPPTRAVKPPSDAIFFQNSKENLKGESLKNFLGFTLYYPKDWTRSEAKNNFLDVSKSSEKGLPVEQFLVAYYNSKGTFKADEKTFAEQVKKTNETLKKIVPNYKLVSEGEKTVNNGWRAYEVKFQGTGKAANGEKITLWGRRLFIPTAIRGMKNGYVITMLATSLSKQVKSVDDVGVKGELAGILETFEPNQSF